MTNSVDQNLWVNHIELITTQNKLPITHFAPLVGLPQLVHGASLQWERNILFNDMANVLVKLLGSLLALSRKAVFNI